MGVVLNIFDVMEMIGIISFAISGAMVGIRKQLDFFGVLILGIVHRRRRRRPARCNPPRRQTPDR